MARLVAFAFLAWLLTGAFCLDQFINPPSFGTKGDFSGNPIYNEGSTVNIVWMVGDPGQRFSLVLYQLRETSGDWFGDMEYLTKGVVGETSYSWLVGTRKNLSVSSLFYLSLFQEGQGVSLMNSHYFNIEAKEAKEQSPLQTSSSTSPSSTTSVASNVSSTPSPPITSSTSNQPPSSSSTSEPTSKPTSATNPENQSISSGQPSNNFPVGTVVGIGVGILVVLVICFGAGLVLFRRRKNKRKMKIFPVSSPYPQIDYRNNNGSYYGSNLNEAPPRSPVEMSHHRDSFVPHHDRRDRQAGSVEAEPVRYEM